MSRWLALAETPENGMTRMRHSTECDKTEMEGENRPFVTFCQSSQRYRNEIRGGDKPDVDAFEERAAIIEFDGGLSRADAENLAARCQGFENVVTFRVAAKSNGGSNGT